LRNNQNSVSILISIKTPILRRIISQELLKDFLLPLITIKII
jgi:hypothetical protein